MLPTATQPFPVRALPTVALVLSIVGLLYVATIAASDGRHQGDVYPLSMVWDHLQRDPGHWLGRTIRVRAVAEPCPWWDRFERAQHCAGLQVVLIDADGAAPAAPLPLEPPATHPLVTTLRRLPLLGRLLPRPDVITLYATARFRVRLEPLPPGACGRSPCFAARLLGLSREAG